MLSPDQIDQIVEHTETSLDRAVQTRRITLDEYNKELKELHIWESNQYRLAAKHGIAVD